MLMQRTILVCVLAITFAGRASAADAPSWKDGVARANITPEGSMWMSGIGSRDKPSEGKLQDLWAKAVAIEDPAGERFVLITLDLVGIDRATSERICTQLANRHGLERRQIAINTSHTHCGPVVGRNLVGMFGFDERGWQVVDTYTARLVEQIVTAASEAIGKLQPSR